MEEGVPLASSCHFIYLLDDILGLIFLQLDLADLGRLLRTCKTMKQRLESTQNSRMVKLWRIFVLNKFSVDYFPSKNCSSCIVDTASGSVSENSNWKAIAVFCSRIEYNLRGGYLIYSGSNWAENFNKWKSGN